jgi:hypothetical protein
VSHAPTRAPMSKSGMAVGGETNSITPGGMLVAGVHMPESMPQVEDYPLPAGTWAARAGICMPPTSEDGPCVGECASPAGNEVPCISVSGAAGVMPEAAQTVTCSTINGSS